MSNRVFRAFKGQVQTQVKGNTLRAIIQKSDEAVLKKWKMMRIGSDEKPCDDD
jgi:hypothetical protein